MMKNKVELKKFLALVMVISVCLLLTFYQINKIEQEKYKNNYNKKIVQIISKVKEEYPKIEENELMAIINNEELNYDLFKKYSINLNQDSLILENEVEYQKSMFINLIFIIFTIIIMMIMFLLYNYKKDRKIKRITRCIEEINKKNYKLDLDEMSEDELSILKNEIYKTTLMLKEEAENSKKEKLGLKDSLSDISHQLKTPLTSILIALDNIIDNPDMEKEVRDDFIRDIKREITNISFLVQSILKLSKFDTNTIDFLGENILVKDILDETCKNLAMLCDLKNVKLKVLIEDEAIIKCDFKWQTEAICNVIKNCIEHSDKDSEVLIKVSNNKIYTQIIIEDNGNGIDSSDLPHIFERFYKGKNATQDSIGIGLSLAKAIIEKDNGTISVDSNNNGTKFIIKYFKQ